MGRMMEDKEYLLCKDCKNSFRDWSEFFFGTYSYRCRKYFNPPKQELDLVLGPQKKSAYYERCSSARGKYSGKCGEEGKDYSPKNKKYFFTYLKQL